MYEFGSNSVANFVFNVSNLLFFKYLRYRRTQQAVVTFKRYNPVWIASALPIFDTPQASFGSRPMRSEPLVGCFIFLFVNHR